MGRTKIDCEQNTRFMGIGRRFQCNRRYRRETGGRSFRIEKSLDFLSCISDCGLQDACFFGNIFTWSDNRGPQIPFGRDYIDF